MKQEVIKRGVFRSASISFLYLKIYFFVFICKFFDYDMCHRTIWLSINEFMFYSKKKEKKFVITCYCTLVSIFGSFISSFTIGVILHVHFSSIFLLVYSVMFVQATCIVCLTIRLSRCCSFFVLGCWKKKNQ